MPWRTPAATGKMDKPAETGCRIKLTEKQEDVLQGSLLLYVCGCYTPRTAAFMAAT